MADIVALLDNASQRTIRTHLAGSWATEYPDFYYEGKETYFEMYCNYIMKKETGLLKKTLDGKDFQIIVGYLNAKGTPGPRAILEFYGNEKTRASQLETLSN